MKPFVKQSKNDRNDAEAICEAASRPTMRAVPVKTPEEQAATIVVKYLELLVRQRTQAINALRGHAAEFGVIAAQRCSNTTVLLAVLAGDEAIPDIARTMFEQIACRVLGQPRATQRKPPVTPDDKAALTEDIITLARQYGRYGYRRITALLRDAGWLVNKKRVERIWRREGLNSMTTDLVLMWPVPRL